MARIGLELNVGRGGVVGGELELVQVSRRFVQRLDGHAARIDRYRNSIHSVIVSL